MPEQYLVEESFVNVKFLENENGEIAHRADLLSIVEIVNIVKQIEIGILPLVNEYILGQTLGTDSICLFDWYSKDYKGNLLSSGTAVPLKFDT